MINTPQVSVVVCTRNRAEFLPVFLDSLSKISTLISWEIVFVNNSSSDNTQQLLEDFAANISMPVHIVFEALPGLGRARNAGWHAAQADIITFTDDDCYPQQDFIDQIWSEFQDQSIGFVGGRVELYDLQDLPITIKVDKLEKFFPAYTFIGPGYLHGANFSFRKQLLKSINGFDSFMGSGTSFPAEDCDAVYRALNAGYNGKYSPDIVVYHHHRRRTELDRMKIEQTYLAGRGAFYAKTLFNSSKKMRTLYHWMRSANLFGWKFLLKEILIGIDYLVYIKKNNKK